MLLRLKRVDRADSRSGEIAGIRGGNDQVVTQRGGRDIRVFDGHPGCPPLQICLQVAPKGSTARVKAKNAISHNVHDFRKPLFEVSLLAAGRQALHSVRKLRDVEEEVYNSVSWARIQWSTFSE